MQKSLKGIKNWIQQGSYDMPFFIIVILLLTGGVIMLYSASYVSASYSKEAGYDPAYYFKRQLLFAVVGVIVMLVVSRIRVTVLKKFAYIFALIYLALLVLVLVMPAKIDNKEDFRRWLDLPLLPQFQPSELAKFGLILFCARVLSERKKIAERFGNHDLAIPICFVMMVLTCGLVLAENHLSCTILLLGIGAAMLVLGGVRTRWIVAAISVSVVGLTVFLLFHEQIIPKLPIGTYAQNRLIAWLDKDSFAKDIRWQTNQSLYAIGSGGLFGQGLGKSKQKHLYMPEPQNDFIFSIICEELGFVGAVAILVVFALLIWRGFVIAMNSDKRFNALLVMGIITQIGLQTILNVLVVTDTIPNTGISLPFFSYGGSSLLVLLGEMGIVLSVSRASNLQKK
ncbi:MAG: FtsW/RodA/SpoVE family cell cycle protein [Oscillospiraceae bacterium]|nr:FtsW/RodA/SpoVE family cell cycle protein [Oscillospiraceae bacterium]